jgi:hypothetical protein
VAAKSTKKRNKALDALDTLRAKGATAATFNSDGSIASVTFAATPAAQPVPAAKPAVVEEILASPKWPRTDLDGLDELPAYGEGN